MGVGAAVARWSPDSRVGRLAAGVAALTAGLAIASSEVLRPIFPTVDDVACDTGASHAVNAVDLAKFAAIGVAIVMLARLVRGRLSKTGTRVAFVAAIASVVTGVANGVEHCAHLEALGLVYALGLMVSVLATIGYGILLARSGEIPRWIGWVVAAGTLAFLVGAEQGWGWPVDAIAWIAVGAGLLVRALQAARDAPS